MSLEFCIHNSFDFSCPFLPYAAVSVNHVLFLAFQGNAWLLLAFGHFAASCSLLLHAVLLFTRVEVAPSWSARLPSPCPPRGTPGVCTPLSRCQGLVLPNLSNCHLVWCGNSCYVARFKQCLVVALICIFQILISWHGSSWSFQSSRGTHVSFLLFKPLAPSSLGAICFLSEGFFVYFGNESLVGFVCYEYVPADDMYSLFWHSLVKKSLTFM